MLGARGRRGAGARRASCSTRTTAPWACSARSTGPTCCPAGSVRATPPDSPRTACRSERREALRIGLADAVLPGDPPPSTPPSSSTFAPRAAPPTSANGSPEGRGPRGGRAAPPPGDLPHPRARRDEPRHLRRPHRLRRGARRLPSQAAARPPAGTAERDAAVRVPARVSHRRIDYSDDYVAVEIATALVRNIPACGFGRSRSSGWADVYGRLG